MSKLMRNGTAEPVSRDQILRREGGQENINFPCSADHEQDVNLTWLVHSLAVCVTIHTDVQVGTITITHVLLLGILVGPW